MLIVWTSNVPRNTAEDIEIDMLEDDNNSDGDMVLPSLPMTSVSNFVRLNKASLKLGWLLPLSDPSRIPSLVEADEVQHVDKTCLAE